MITGDTHARLAQFCRMRFLMGIKPRTFGLHFQNVVGLEQSMTLYYAQDRSEFCIVGTSARGMLCFTCSIYQRPYEQSLRRPRLYTLAGYQCRRVRRNVRDSRFLARLGSYSSLTIPNPARNTNSSKFSLAPIL